MLLGFQKSMVTTGIVAVRVLMLDRKLLTLGEEASPGGHVNWRPGSGRAMMIAYRPIDRPPPSWLERE